MSTKSKYATYPNNYRAKEVAQVAQWIQAGESGSIIGLGGAGKSNFMNFLCRRPDVVHAYLPDDAPRLALVLVDLNNMPGDDLSTFFRVMLRSLFEAAPRLRELDTALVDEVERLYRKVEEKTDPFLPQSALREVLMHFQSQDLRLVLVFDPFDRFCQTASLQLLDNLRGLRDGFKATLSYLAGVRTDLPHLIKSIATSELYEILDTHRCWLSTMSDSDSRWVIGQRESATGQSFSDEARQRLIELTGGYPALLRAAALWLAQQQRNGDTPKLTTWETILSSEQSIQNRLADLRQGLTGAEEAALFALQSALEIKSGKDRNDSLRQIEEKHRETLQRLVAKGLCLNRDGDWRLFSPLFARYVMMMEGVSTGIIWRDPTTQRFYKGDQELADLARKDRQLLGFLVDNPQKICSLDELIQGAWLDENETYSGGVSNETVQQAIRQLRKKIELNPAKPRYLVTVRGDGYYFDPDGSPQN
ncbi:MAG: winged helix-turn-helix domain-containing protein [Anaerolineae bacterium]|nr:winged helix-turn-helix domain-containing protein [Anaerolineae bacterium]